VSGLRVGDVLAVLDELYPPALAESWDVVGLAIGSRDQPVARVHLAVDCTAAVIAEARAAGADLLVCHHPPFLRGITAVVADEPKGRLVTDAIAAGISVVVAHTNADLPAHSTVEALADLVGIGAGPDRRPLVPRPAPGGDEVDKIVTFVPPDHAAVVVDALTAAGAGRIGRYERCAFTLAGEGTYRPLPGAEPFSGTVGTVSAEPETRIEMVLDRSRRRAVTQALLAAHPYEEPAWDLYELAEVPDGSTGLGRVGDLTEPTTLGGVVDRLLAGLPPTPRGLNVAGDPDRPITRVAVQAGSGDDLFEQARRSGAELYVTSDLRHHPASDALAWEDAPALIDIPHWAAEWLWLPVAERELGRALGDRALPSTVSPLCTDPWTAHV
jgi:dinuclear metal center YbgI/SA1388 family protein